MIWTPSPRPPWSEWPMHSMLQDATAFMAYLSPIEPLSPPPPRRRRDDFEGEALGLRRNLRHGKPGEISGFPQAAGLRHPQPSAGLQAGEAYKIFAGQSAGFGEFTVSPLRA